MVEACLKRVRVQNLLPQRCVPRLSPLGSHSRAPGGPPSPGASSRPAPHLPRQPYNELEVLAGIGLLAVLIACVAYIVSRLL